MTKHSFYLLGELEKQIMEIIWERGTVTVRDVVKILRKKRHIAYTTVMTVMYRLAEKRLLNRKDHTGAFEYSAAQKRESFFSRASGDIIKKLISECGDVAIAEFVKTLDKVDPKKLELLEKKIREKSNERI
ncbi:MAG: hypothetical protein A2898_04595 [Candidatus Kerfeldbacteria bacterium RIFCSPLOWO2_01_FULL_48_11]|uniref:CopY family transcriptional regulator n=1 Tax=Candidatus Kerfeldbacteria bacterium RIFCSPLOWO2_01_FULL_48_11 TaxID=1798543 RepID=A0A1G2B3Q6_9BACT|nr:MAG: Transcriptional repressor, CopY family [Parcubacteria group bacterium GW2011_GWA2_48_9]KKW16641.1 MAG: Transcriptional repressor, CopY family [Parcubacteria group bacterium GW2011_GWC2_49_9]OGY82840.1 MAG: hypothetical protein A2898_04595 [Candidatus Kerfeldbacteria bacterium RIFCSPLOWO2_01_FULL_48_11]HCJ52424.1 CopY family transcriptional regulator [Candidatus Kerfeldbacteria bacterium]HCM68298.1 CopY family transcriptional regulator [Candidatus Kerfeldbacteria bacterium]